MTQKEFTDRTGMTPTPDEFNRIHAIYLSTVLDKDKFCEDYKKHHDSRIINDLHATAVNYKLCKESQQKQIGEVVDFLIGKSRAHDDTDFRRMAVKLAGEKEVVRKTIEMGLPLWYEDKEYIKDLLDGKAL